MENDNQVIIKKPEYLYEIDFIRTITVFSVVAIHTFSTLEAHIPVTQNTIVLENLFNHLLHYNREMFMFVTGLVLTYVYFNREFSAKKFWLRRALLVFVPYVLWTLIYVKINNSLLQFPAYIFLSLQDILTGNASYQLYYILIALEFYAIFPLYKIFLKKVVAHPWLTLGISLSIQLLFAAWDFYYFHTAYLHSTGLVKEYVMYQDSIIFSYQFFFIFGGIAAVYMQPAYAFFKKNWLIIPLLFVLTLFYFCSYYYWQINGEHLSTYYATRVLQPYVAIYSIVIIIFYSWIATIWARRKKAFRLIRLITETSFGIYFVHVLVISTLLQYLFPLYPAAMPLPIKLLSFLFIVFTISLTFCMILLKIPFLRWTIGRVKQ